MAARVAVGRAMAVKAEAMAAVSSAADWVAAAMAAD